MTEIKNNRDILTILNPNENANLSQLTIGDKLNIMESLNEYYLQLRPKLNIDKNITFGLEIEFEDAKRDIIEQELAFLFPDQSWKVVDDGSLYNGGEINSPVLTNNEKTWSTLKQVCDIVDANASILENAGGHVHIGVQILGNNPKKWYNFALLWTAYEHIIFRFLYGEYISPRGKIKEQAAPIALDVINKLDKLKEYSKMNIATYIIHALNGEGIRKRAVNFTNVVNIPAYQLDQELFGNTLEFRSGNGTKDEIIWQGRVDLLAHLFLYATSDNFNEELIMKRIKANIENGIPSNLKEYTRIRMNDCFELADIIYDNNLDKVYFLRQYFKSGEVCTKANTISSNFIKR